MTKDVEINLNTVADTGDAEQLLRLMSRLGFEMKKAGTDGARSLHEELRSMYNELAKNRKTISAEAVKSLVPDVGKIKAAFSIDNLESVYSKGGTKGSRDFVQRLELLKRTIKEGKLSQETVDALTVSTEKFLESARKLPGADLKKIRGDIDKVVQSSQELREAMAKVGGYRLDTKDMVDGINLGSEAADALNLRFGTTENILLKILAKFPLIGTALLKLGKIPLLFAISGIIFAVKSIYDWLVKIHNEEREINFDNARRNLDQINESFSRQNELLDITHSKNMAVVSAMKEQLSVEKDLIDSQRELNRAKELEGVTDERMLALINSRYERQRSGADIKNEKSSLALEKKQNAEEIASLEKQIDLLKKKESDSRKAWIVSSSIAADAEEASYGFLANLPGGVSRFFGIETAEEAKETSQTHGNIAKDALSAADSAASERRKLEVELERLRKQKAVLAKKEAVLAVKASAASAEQHNKEIDRSQDIARAQESLKYDEEKRIERQTDEDRNARQSLSELTGSLHTRLNAAKENLDIFTRREEEAKKEFDALKVFRRSDGSFMAGGGRDAKGNEAAFGRASRDYDSYRSSRVSAQSAVNSILQEFRNRAFEVSERDRQEARENEEFVRQGKYGRAGFGQRVAMDRARYASASRQFTEMDRRLRDADSGRISLTANERTLTETLRGEARSIMLSTREALRGSMLEGDTQRAGFISGILGRGNRLTQMGLGGDVADWNKQTASNTGRIFSQCRDIIRLLQQNDVSRVRWGL